MTSRAISLMRNAVVLTAALMGVTSFTLLTTDLAEAKPRTRQDRHGACLGRCVRAHETTEAMFRCQERTCDHQFSLCLKDTNGTGEIPDRGSAAGGPTSGGKPPARPGRPGGGKPGLAQNNSGPFVPDILGGGPGGLSPQNPASTGVPMTPKAPAAPAPIIR